MSVRKNARAVLAVLTVTLAGGCDPGATQASVGSDASIPPGPVLRSVAGIRVPETRMRAILAEFTRDMAVSLSDPNVRKAVYDGLHASQFRENKVHFRTFLQDGGTPLRSALRVRRGDEQVLVATLDSPLCQYE